MPRGGAGNQQRTQHVDIELLSVQGFGGVFDLGELVDARVVHHDVQPPEVLDGRPDQRLDVRLLGDIRSHRHRRPASGFDVGHHLVGTASA
ncbi:hypothetical protein D3C86_1915500 [compost metagenome]